jgi:hypothetical protein
MPHTPTTAIEAIQAILAPALGISAVGLLLLGLYNRYSNIINRIRSLNEERRRYVKLIADDTELSYTDNIRYININSQSKELLIRSRLVRNAILFLMLAVGLFVLTSVTIAAGLLFDADSVKGFPLISFVLGMLSVLTGVVWAALEVHRSYKIVLLEANID